MTPNAARAAEALEAVDRLQVRAYTDIRDEWKDLGLLRAALSQPDAWVAVSERLPKAAVAVFVFYRSRGGRGRSLCAEWSDGHSLPAREDEEPEDCNYDEGEDRYYVKEGWYEWSDNEDGGFRVYGDVTHWQPLPPAPAAAPEMKEMS